MYSLPYHSRQLCYTKSISNGPENVAASPTICKGPLYAKAPLNVLHTQENGYAVKVICCGNPRQIVACDCWIDH